MLNLLLLVLPLSLLFGSCSRRCWLCCERAKTPDVTDVHALHIKGWKLCFALPHVMDGWATTCTSTVLAVDFESRLLD
jgi:hypothetical protein